MGQSRTAGIFAATLLALLVLCPACDRPAPPPAAKPFTIASLSPAATDLLLAMDAGERLVAVSNFDGDRPDARHLPRVGDYQNIDWEKLASLRPTVMVVQGRPDRMPPGLKPKADALGIRVVNVQIDTVEDIFKAADILGEAIADPAAATAKVAAVRAQLDAVRQRVAGRPKVRTLIVVGPETRYVAGHGTFLSELLDIAGGENVVPKESGPWPSIDHEMLVSLKPQAILQMLPGASDQALAKATSAWTALPNVPAVQNGRVYPITEWYVNQPGARIGDTAKLFADKLHGNP